MVMFSVLFTIFLYYRTDNVERFAASQGQLDQARGGLRHPGNAVHHGPGRAAVSGGGVAQFSTLGTARRNGAIRTSKVSRVSDWIMLNSPCMVPTGVPSGQALVYSKASPGARMG